MVCARNRDPTDFSRLKVNGLPSGAEIAVLRGKLETGSSESLLRLSPGYKMPIHSHTRDELYVWLEGAFTLIAHDPRKISCSRIQAQAFDSTALQKNAHLT